MTPMIAIRAAAFACTLAAATFVTPAAAETIWNVDAAHSSAEFSVRHLVVGTVRGTIPIASATFETATGTPLPARIVATLDVAALDTHNADRDTDLRGKDWFDAAHFPTMTFKTSKIEAGATPGSFRAMGT